MVPIPVGYLSLADVYTCLLLESKPPPKNPGYTPVSIALQSSAHTCIIEDHNCHIIYKVVTNFLLM